jgi:hypothetical protein
MQARKADRAIKPLATHGRPIHVVNGCPCDYVGRMSSADLGEGIGQQLFEVTAGDDGSGQAENIPDGTDHAHVDWPIYPLQTPSGGGLAPTPEQKHDPAERMTREWRDDP